MLDYIQPLFTPQRQTRSVVIAAVVICAAYFPIASMVASHETFPPWPPGDPVRLLGIQKMVQDGLPNGGVAYFTKASAVSAFEDDDAKAQKSPVILYEDDRPLGPARSDHYDVERLGQGRYSHWKHLGILFSASDNSDPRQNGRAYFAVQPAGAR
jgi:hypothetical protein